MRSRCAGRCDSTSTARTVYAVDGTPTDCVNIAVAVLLEGRAARSGGVGHQHRVEPRRRRDLFRHRVGRARSGTARRSGDRRVADAHPRLVVRLRPVGARSRTIWRRAFSRSGLPERTFLNVNVPKGTPKGVRVTVQGKRNHVTTIAEREDPRGLRYFWIEEGRGRLAAARPQRLPGVPRRLRVGHPAAAGHDGARGAVATTRDLLKVSAKPAAVRARRQPARVATRVRRKPRR